MATQIRTWQIVEGKLQALDTSLADQGRTEPYDLEAWIASDPSILGTDLRIIGRQVPTRSGPLDLLAIDQSGDLVIVELKRDRLPREALVQAIDYASDVATWGLDKVSEVCAKHTGQTLEEMLTETFDEFDLEAISVNQSQRILLVGFAIESALERMIGWLSDSYGVSLNAILLNYICTDGGEELLTKTAIISEEVEAERAKKKKFTIPMSDEPGAYEEEELERLLTAYLSSDRRTAELIHEVLIPACLEQTTITRDELKDRIVAYDEEADPGKVGFVVSVLSGQLGMKKNDFLRQAISYEYPKYPWEKDNYRVRQGYRDLLQRVLTMLGADTRLEAPALEQATSSPEAVVSQKAGGHSP